MSKRAKTSHVGTNEALERASRVDVAVSFLKPALPANGGDVPALVRLTGVLEQDAVVRAPLDVALVLDSSGSMHGEPMTFAIQAAHDAIDLLEAGDRVSIITFSSRANVVVPLQTIEENRTALHAAVETIRAHGGTALHAGWATGAHMLAEASEPGRFARVVLLTDGHANVGTKDPTVIAMEVAQLRARGITTSTVGLGRQFTEDLLASMSEAGDGRFAFAEVASEVQPIMAAELIGVDATVGRNVRLRFQDRGARGALTQVLNDLPVDGDATVVPDLVADMPFDLVGVVRVQAGTPLEGEHLGDLDLTWTGPDGTTQARCLPVIANLVDPEAYDAMEANSDVLAAYAAIAVSRHRKDAVAALDRGDHAAVMSALAAIDTLLQDAPETRAIQRERVAVDRIRQAVQRGDEVLSRKRLLFEEQRSRRGFRFEELEESHRYNEREAILRDRRARREAGARAAAGAATPACAESEASDDPTQKPAFATLQVPRADGTTAEIRLGLGDLTHAAVDAIVNPTNPQLFGQGPSVDGAVHRRGWSCAHAGVPADRPRRGGADRRHGWLRAARPLRAAHGKSCLRRVAAHRSAAGLLLPDELGPRAPNAARTRCIPSNRDGQQPRSSCACGRGSAESSSRGARQP